MSGMLRAEALKRRHTFAGLLPFAAPVLTLFLVLPWAGGAAQTFFAGAWNWWYTLLLPGTLAVACDLGLKKDKKTAYYHMLSLPVPVERCVCGKLFYEAVCLLLADMLLFAGSCAGLALCGMPVCARGFFLAALLLTVTFLWEIPLFLFLSARFGTVCVLVTSLALSFVSVIAANTALWWVCPAAIPIRLMCPVLGILPNGLPVPADSHLWDRGVILPGVLLALAWAAVLICAVPAWFSRRAVDE